MTVTVFLILLTACAAVTSLLTEGIKKLLDEMGVKYASNVLVLFVAVIDIVQGRSPATCNHRHKQDKDIGGILYPHQAAYHLLRYPIL